MSRKPRSVASASDKPAIVIDGKIDDTGSNDNSAGVVDSIVDASSGSATVDPASIGNDNDTGIGDVNNEPGKRRRGRPPGSTSGKAKAIPLNVNGLEKLLIGVHTSMAMLSGRMEMLLDTEAKSFDGLTEAQFLAKSIKDVSDHYKTEIFSDKTIDWMNLIQALGIVYGGRFFAIRNAPKTVAAPRPQGPVAVRPGPQPTAHRPNPAPNNPAQPMNGNDILSMVDALPTELRTAEIPIGQDGKTVRVEFPSDHPLMGGRKH